MEQHYQIVGPLLVAIPLEEREGLEDCADNLIIRYNSLYNL